MVLLTGKQRGHNRLWCQQSHVQSYIRVNIQQTNTYKLSLQQKMKSNRGEGHLANITLTVWLADQSVTHRFEHSGSSTLRKLLFIRGIKTNAVKFHLVLDEMGTKSTKMLQPVTVHCTKTAVDRLFFLTLTLADC